MTSSVCPAYKDHYRLKTNAAFFTACAYPKEDDYGKRTNSDGNPKAVYGIMLIIASRCSWRKDVDKLGGIEILHLFNFWWRNSTQKDQANPFGCREIDVGEGSKSWGYIDSLKCWLELSAIQGGKIKR